jgi:uncharacterized membrane protein HdeD (DUF308 family)
MSFLARSRYGPFLYVGLGVALVIFALVVTSASRLVFVVGGVAIVAGLANGIARLTRARRDSSTGTPHR